MVLFFIYWTYFYYLYHLSFIIIHELFSQHSKSIKIAWTFAKSFEFTSLKINNHHCWCIYFTTFLDQMLDRRNGFYLIRWAQYDPIIVSSSFYDKSKFRWAQLWAFPYKAPTALR